MDVLMYVSFEAGFQLGVSNGFMTFGITEMKFLEVETTIAQEDLVSQEAVLSQLVTQSLVPTFLESFGGEESGFPIPEMDLGNGAVIGIEASTISRLPGYTLISGGIQ